MDLKILEALHTMHTKFYEIALQRLSKMEG